MDRVRREYIEERRRRLEELRTNPYEYRRRMYARRMQQNSRTSTVRNISSFEEQRRMNATRPRPYQGNRNNGGYKNEKTPRKMRPRKRRRRRVKNCGTKQPKYQWKKKNQKRDTEMREHYDKQNKVQYASIIKWFYKYQNGFFTIEITRKT